MASSRRVLKKQNNKHLGALKRVTVCFFEDLHDDTVAVKAFDEVSLGISISFIHSMIFQY